MAYTLHFRCSKQDILPWVIQDIADPFNGIDYRILKLDTHVWHFDLVFKNKDQSQDFLVKLMSGTLPGNIGKMLQQIKQTHPTAQEQLTAS
jgi:hypothetical protein